MKTDNEKEGGGKLRRQKVLNLKLLQLAPIEKEDPYIIISNQNGENLTE